MFDPIFEITRQFRIEKYDQLPRSESILCPAEAERVHPGLPGQLGWRTFKMGQRIRETSTVHVHQQILAAAKFTNGFNVHAGINRS